LRPIRSGAGVAFVSGRVSERLFRRVTPRMSRSRISRATRLRFTRRLAMLALAFLTAVAASTTSNQPADPHHRARSRGPIELTVPEIRDLLAAALTPPVYWSRSCTGQTGADTTRQQPGAATTDGASTAHAAKWIAKPDWSTRLPDDT
jgi:hypothetical protein